MDVGGQLGQFPLHGAEWTVDRRHEHAAQEIDHRHLLVVARGQHGVSPSRGLVRVVGRSDDAGFGLQHLVDFAAAIDVVAHRNAVHAAGDQLAVDGRGQSRPPGRVLGVGRHEIDLLFDAQGGYRFDNDLPPWLAYDVSDKK